MSWLSLVGDHQLAASDSVSFRRLEQVGAREPRGQLVAIEREDDEVIVMRLSGRRSGAAIEGPPKSGDSLDGAADRRRHRRARLERNVLGHAARRWRNVVDEPMNEGRR